MKLLDPRRNQALKKMPLILGSGKRRSITKDFGMREVTEFQETSVVTLGFQLPTPTYNSIWRWHLSPTSTTKGASLWSWPYTSFSPPHISFCGLLPQPPILRPVREGSHTHTQPTAFSSTLPLPGFHSSGTFHHPGHCQNHQEKRFQNKAWGGKVCQRWPLVPFALLLPIGSLQCCS